MPLPEGVRQYTHLWPMIQAGTWARATTAELVTELRGEFLAKGQRFGQQMWDAINTMRSVAVAQRNGTERFNRAAEGDVLTPQMAAPELNVRPQSVRDLMPEIKLDVQLRFIDRNGDEATTHTAVIDVWRPGMTRGELLANVADTIEQQALDYGTAYVGHTVVRVTQL